MFCNGNYVVCKNSGICKVEGITTLNFEGVDSNKPYYLLKPVFSNGSTIYRPVDDDSIRSALDKSQAEKLIEDIPSIDTIPIADEKTLEKTYKELIHSCNPVKLVQLIKTIQLRKQRRLLKGFKVTALDSRYFKQAEDFLYGELAVALDITKNEVKECLLTQISQFP